MNSKVLEFITTIRDSFEGSEVVYTQGACYHFYLILKCLFFDAVAWYDGIEGHVYTEIEGRFYDIRGEHKKGNWYLLSSEPRIEREARGWMYKMKI